MFIVSLSYHWTADSLSAQWYKILKLNFYLGLLGVSRTALERSDNIIMNHQITLKIFSKIFSFKASIPPTSCWTNMKFYRLMEIWDLAFIHSFWSRSETKVEREATKINRRQCWSGGCAGPEDEKRPDTPSPLSQ